MLSRPNFLIHLIWAILGIGYLTAMLICGGNLFSQFDNLDAGPGFWEYVFLGNALPAFLNMLSVIGVISLLHIPFTCEDEFDFKGIFNWFFNKVTFTVIGIIPLLVGYVCLYTNSGFVAYYYDKTVVGTILSLVAVAAPFFFVWLNEMMDEFDHLRHCRAAGLLLLSAILSFLAGLIVFIKAMIIYDALSSFLIFIFIICGIVFILAPATYYVIVIITK